MEYNSNFTQEITLPSQGLLNPEIPEGKVTQRCMMVADQKFLTGVHQGPGNALQQIIQRTTTAPENFDVMALTASDTLYLLFKLRILSYGKDYKFRTRCPECGNKIDVQVDLSQLPVEILEEDYKEKLEITLPHRGDKVYTRVLTNQDLEDVAAEAKRRKRRNPDDESEYILRIVKSIEKIKLVKDKSEITHPIDIERYVSTLTDYDARTITATRDKASFGINPIFEYTCPECREEIDLSLQFSSEFFRPSIS